MTQRKTIDQITSDELDQLYNHCDQLAAGLTELLNRFHPHPTHSDPAAYLCHPLDPHEHKALRAALDAGPALTDPAGRLAIIRNAAVRLLGYGASMSARWVLDVIDKAADEPARTTPNNPTTSTDTKEN